jgi:predicted phage-related endonuclease
MANAEKIAADRALALLFSVASEQRVAATKVVHTGAQALAASHHRTAELINQLAAAAPQIWAQTAEEGS